MVIFHSILNKYENPIQKQSIFLKRFRHLLFRLTEFSDCCSSEWQGSSIYRSIQTSVDDVNDQVKLVTSLYINGINPLEIITITISTNNNCYFCKSLKTCKSCERNLSFLNGFSRYLYRCYLLAIFLKLISLDSVDY